jgi:hypothetical protein
MPDLVTAEPNSPYTLSVEQQALIYGHLEEGKLTQTAIAELVGVTRQTIHYYADKFKLSPKWILRSQGVNLTQSWLRAVPQAEARGDIRPMERALLYGGHLEPLLANAPPSVVVQLGVVLNPVPIDNKGVIEAEASGMILAPAITVPDEDEAAL